MTPALLYALDKQYIEDVGVLTLPVDKLAWMYANANRDPGEKKDGVEIRPPAPFINLDEFRTYRRKLKSLAAKDSWDHSLQGARADREAFEAWGGSKIGVEYVPVHTED